MVGNTLIWDGYEIYHPGVFGPLNSLPRTEARRAFNQLMGAKPARMEILRRLLRVSGVELATSTSIGVSPPMGIRLSQAVGQSLTTGE